MSIYNELKKPIFSLAPMEDVTDSVFRQIVGSVGKPDLFYTEFVNVEGLNSKGKDRVIHRLKFEEKEKPIIAQLWGVNPKNFFEATKLVKEMGFDGVDINMGCSVKNVVKNNAGSGLIREEREIVKDIINAVKEGAQGLPVSVKTRLGFEEVNIDGWIRFLMEQSLDALTVHMRTARGKDCIYANWEYMTEIVDLRNSLSSNTLLFGNGDIKSMTEAKEKLERYGIDGVMIGRAVISNPWFFTGREDISKEEKLSLFKDHLNLFENTWGNEKDFNSLKKFFKAYINDFDGASQLRMKFMECSSIEEIYKILEGENPKRVS